MTAGRSPAVLPGVRLATFNILHGRSFVDHEVDLDRFSGAVAGLDADVLALQEVDRSQPRSHGADLTRLAAEAMGATDHRFMATMTGTPGQWHPAADDHAADAPAYGISLLSRHPVLSWRALRLAPLPFRAPAFHADSLRPRLVHDEPRAALAAVVDTPDGELTVIATHLTFVPGWNVVQLRRLLRAVRRSPRPAVLMGDLNIRAPRAARLTGWRPLVTAPSFPVGAPDRQIDHVLAQGDLRVTSAGTVHDTGVSDHRALVVEVRVGGHEAPR
ncbi:endonuclease/exonuclease/phosphatase family protein [Actinotalea sp. K2]|uniref:endonuclease/exonuclease/phosphatase family protein n=1 Tax=Actinotalea sp. K2 TaxID=2939438 RepID=UPI002016AA73|nr:endonuclease/exonuclease/phosphatase family protein [Actinotalea sp. K2]MCL3861334.1 endonuclease/exonuclease/phosphatase family protein [Actinotalea sp. K2]